MDLQMQMAILGERWENKKVLEGIPLKVFYEGPDGLMVVKNKCWMRNNLRHRGHVIGSDLQVHGEGEITIFMPKAFHFHFHRGRKCRFERTPELDNTANIALIKQD